MIKAIVFDFAGVIAPGMAFQYVKNLPENHLRRLLFNEACKRWDMENMPVEEFFQLISQITEISVEEVEEKVYGKAEIFPGIVALIKELKKKYKLALFSNNFSYIVRKVLVLHDIEDLFDEIIISSDHNMIKPDEKFYHHMLNIINCKPDEVIFIDDTQENVDTGNRLGITSLLYTQKDSLLNSLKTLSVLP